MAVIMHFYTEFDSFEANHVKLDSVESHWHFVPQVLNNTSAEKSCIC